MTFINLESMERREINPGYRAIFIHSERMTLAYWTVEAGAPLPEHHHPHEQITNILEGEFELTIDGNTQILHPGSVAIIPPNVIHSGRAITSCIIIDAFSPCREDYQF